MTTHKNGVVQTATSRPKSPMGILDSPPVESLEGLPESLLAGIQQADQLLQESSTAASEGDIELARIRAKQGLKAVQVLASSNPQLAAQLLAAAAGYRTMKDHVVCREDHYYPEDVKFFGITVGKSMQHRSIIKTYTATRSLG